jgi:hypothetical protein
MYSVEKKMQKSREDCKVLPCVSRLRALSYGESRKEL